MRVFQMNGVSGFYIHANLHDCISNLHNFLKMYTIYISVFQICMNVRGLHMNGTTLLCMIEKELGFGRICFFAGCRISGKLPDIRLFLVG